MYFDLQPELLSVYIYCVCVDTNVHVYFEDIVIKFKAMATASGLILEGEGSSTQESAVPSCTWLIELYFCLYLAQLYFLYTILLVK